MKSPGYHGLLVLDKPLGVTSRDAVDRALRWFPRGTRVGHTGTLDPLASGVLVLCIGQATRLTEYVQKLPKTYVADVRLGARSATDDAEGPITPVPVDHAPARPEVEALLGEFIGQVAQVPPAYSAAKVAGRRAYDLARGGQEVELAARTVTIEHINLLDYQYPDARLEVHCGKGTYIRSLARDLGDRLGCGAYLAGLRRTRVGPFTPDDAVPLAADADTARARLLPLTAAVAALPRVTLAAEGIARLRNGQRVGLAEAMPPGAEVAVLDPSGSLVAIVTTDPTGLTVRPVKVFA